MSEVPGIPRSTIGQDLRVLRRQAAFNIRTYVEQDLPHEVEMLIQNTNVLLDIAWSSLEKDLEKGKPRIMPFLRY